MLKKVYSLIILGILFLGVMVWAAVPEPGAYTLSDIYNKIIDGTEASAHDFAPATTPASTFVTLTQIWEAIPSFNTLVEGDLATGIFPAGIYSDDIDLLTIEPNLLAENIATGTVMFGITGTCVPPDPDPCDGTPEIGSECNGGSLYAGELNGYKYMTILPDAEEIVWSDEYILTGANSTSDGAGNTEILAGLAGEYPAADYCDSLDVGSYTDWFLPSKDELHFLYGNALVLGFNVSSNAMYLSSSEVDFGVNPEENVWMEYFDIGVQNTTGKISIPGLARCVRKY